MPINSTDAAAMRDYLYHALEQEKYVYIWDKAMQEVNSEVKKIYSRSDDINSRLASADDKISTLDQRYAAQDVQNEIYSSFYAQSASKCKNIAVAMAITMGAVLFLGIIFGIWLASKQTTYQDKVLMWFLTFMLIIMFEIAPFVFFIVYVVKSGNAKRAVTRAENVNLYEQKKNESKELNVSKKLMNTELHKLKLQEQTLKKNQTEIFENLNKSKKTLAEIYSLNVLPAKYRNFVAVATLYEYLYTGRCIQVEGHGGIYDTYENDLRFNMIISTLSDIRKSLNRIENNQQILINEYRQANASLDSIKSSLASIKESNEAIARSNDEIARNTAISAVANQQTAAAARWMAWNSWSR